MSKLSVAVIGAGMGGLATAAALTRAGLEVKVYEQAERFTRLGAGIQIGCNAMKVLREWGLEPVLRQQVFYPRSWNNKTYDTGEIMFDMVFGPSAEERYGAPYLLGHRGDLHAALASAVPADIINLAHRLVGLTQRGDGAVDLEFENGQKTSFDAVIAADGVHSLVKKTLFGHDEPNFTGRIAYRTVFPASLLDNYPIDDCTKWWGPDRHIVIYYVKPDRSEVYFVTSQPEPGFNIESWSTMGDVRELRAAFEGFHPQVRKVLEACPSVPQMGPGRSRSAAAMERRQRHTARGFLPPDDALHGPGRGHGDRRCRRAVEMPQWRRSGRRRRCLPSLRGDAQAAHIARPVECAHQHVAQDQDRSRLGLRL